MKQCHKFTLLALTALALAALPLSAQSQADKPKKDPNPNRAIPFRGTLEAKTADSITVKYATQPSRTLAVTADTKIFKEAKPGTLADGVVGEPVSGSYQEQDGKSVARMIRFGKAPAREPKAETPKPEKAEKPKKP
ncbi:MAG: hypothetical protein ACK45B_02345 [Limisphaerales bacterium]